MNRKQFIQKLRIEKCTYQQIGSLLGVSRQRIHQIITGYRSPYHYRYQYRKYDPFYSCWRHIKARCNNPNTQAYSYYGDRGITICKRWLRFKNFKNDMWESYKKHIEEFGKEQTQIDRIDNNGNYTLKNCRWATRKEQGRNRRDNLLITGQGKTQCLAAWAEELNINYHTLTSKFKKQPRCNETVTLKALLNLE